MRLYHGVWSSHIHATIPHNMGCCFLVKSSNQPFPWTFLVFWATFSWRIRWNMLKPHYAFISMDDDWMVESGGTYHENMDDDWEILVGGWALPLWKIMEFVSWDHDIPNIWKVIIHSCSGHHQPGNPWIFHSYPLKSLILPGVLDRFRCRRAAMPKPFSALEPGMLVMGVPSGSD